MGTKGKVSVNKKKIVCIILRIVLILAVAVAVFMIWQKVAEQRRIERENARTQLAIQTMSELSDNIKDAYTMIHEVSDAEILENQYEFYVERTASNFTYDKNLTYTLEDIVCYGTKVFCNNVIYPNATVSQLEQARGVVLQLLETEATAEQCTIEVLEESSEHYAAYMPDYEETVGQNQYDYFAFYTGEYQMTSNSIEISMTALVGKDNCEVIEVSVKLPEIMTGFYPEGKLELSKEDGETFTEPEEPIIVNMDDVIAESDVFMGLLNSSLKFGVNSDVSKAISAMYSYESSEEIEQEIIDMVTNAYHQLKSEVDEIYSRDYEFSINEYLLALASQCLQIQMIYNDETVGYVAEDMITWLKGISGYELTNCVMLDDETQLTDIQKSMNLVFSPENPIQIYAIYQVDYNVSNNHEDMGEMNVSLYVAYTNQGVYISEVKIDNSSSTDEILFDNYLLEVFEHENVYEMMEYAESQLNRDDYETDDEYYSTVYQTLYDHYPQYFETVSDEFVVYVVNWLGFERNVEEGRVLEIIASIKMSMENAYFSDETDIENGSADSGVDGGTGGSINLPDSVSDILGQIAGDVDVAVYMLKDAFDYQIGNYLSSEVNEIKRGIEDAYDDLKDAWHDFWN